jgi:LuxR family quorum sensing-dependent transcriptional regulator
MLTASACETIKDIPALVAFTDDVVGAGAPNAVLDALQVFAMCVPLSVMGAARLPLGIGDWRSLNLDRDIFLHSSVPKEWWSEYRTMVRREFDPGIMMARQSMMASTWTETRRMLDPIGVDQWPYEMALKHGIRDALTCPVGRRWIVCYWSSKPLNANLTPPLRILLQAAAGFTALRLEQLIEFEPERDDERIHLTPRELAVLRLVSLGRTTEEIAKLLKLGEETVRTHIKKAQDKLGARNRAHAASEAIRRQLIP